MESPPEFLKSGEFCKPKIWNGKAKFVNQEWVRESFMCGEGVRHPTTSVPKNGYPEQTTLNYFGLQLILIS